MQSIGPSEEPAEAYLGRDNDNVIEVDDDELLVEFSDGQTTVIEGRIKPIEQSSVAAPELGTRRVSVRTPGRERHAFSGLGLEHPDFLSTASEPDGVVRAKGVGTCGAIGDRQVSMSYLADHPVELQGRQGRRVHWPNGSEAVGALSGLQWSQSNRSQGTPARSIPSDLCAAGDVLLGKYRITEVLDDGLVVTARAVHLERGTRAQVVLLSPRDPEFGRARMHLLRCSRALSEMQSEYLTRVFDVGTLESGAPFIVTHPVGDCDLGEFLGERGALTLTDAIEYSLGISEALAEGHSHGIVHGSLNPTNIQLVTGIDGWLVPRVSGFGVLGHWCLLESSHNMTANLREVPTASRLAYLSPEQIRRPAEVDLRTDVWSIGAILYELLVGERPFRGESSVGLLAAIVADPVKPISVYRRDVPREVESVVLRCLSKERASRYPSMAEFARELLPFASPDARAIIDRIVRVVARNPSRESANRPPSTALVHVRSTDRNEPRSNGAPQPMNAQTTPTRADPGIRWSLAGTLLVGSAVVAVGLISGIAGAFVSIQALGKQAERNQTDATTTVPSSPQVTPIVYAATPIATPSVTGDAAPSAKAPVRRVATRAANVRSDTSLTNAQPDLVQPAAPSSRRESGKVPTAALERRSEIPTERQHASAPHDGLFDDIR